MKNRRREQFSRIRNSGFVSRPRTRAFIASASAKCCSQAYACGFWKSRLDMVKSPSSKPSNRDSERYRDTEPTEPLRDGATEPQSQRATHATDATYDSAPATTVKSLQDAARLALVFGSDIHALFFYARALKAYEQTTGVLVVDMEEALKEWQAVANAEDFDHDDYLGALIRAYGRAKVPLGANAIHQAMESAPSLSENPDTPERIARLKAVCETLQRISGDSPFFISIRDVATVMQIESLRKAQNAIALLIYQKFLFVAEKGTQKGRKATRFKLWKQP